MFVGLDSENKQLVYVLLVCHLQISLAPAGQPHEKYLGVQPRQCKGIQINTEKFLETVSYPQLQTDRGGVAKKASDYCMILYEYFLNRESHLLCPVVFGFCIEKFKGSAPRLSQGSQHVPIGCWATIVKKQKQL